MTVLLTILFIFLGLTLVIVRRLYANWSHIREGVTVYRCDSNMNVCNKYRVVMLSGVKYLVDLSRNEPYTKYEFSDYLLDLQKCRIYTEDHVDSFD